MTLSRRDVLTGLGATSLLTLGCGKVSSKITPSSKRMILTFDDFGLSFKHRLNPLDRDEAILSVLDKHNIQAAGFVNGRHVDNSQGDVILRRWGKAGHIIANHTWSHENSSQKPVDWVMNDIRRNHEFLKTYKGFQPFFRFPFLAEGGVLEKITDYRIALKAAGYKRAPVTIDTFDWNVSSRLQKYLMKTPKADISAYRNYYVESTQALAAHYQREAVVLGRPSLPHQVLMHHNILNALCLDDVIKSWKADGWTIIPAETALKHPFYQLEPVTPTRGRSAVSVMLIDKNISNPPFPQRYLGFGNKTMDALGL